MRGPHTDDDAGFADFKATRAVYDADVRDVEEVLGGAAEALQLAEGHRCVGFIDKIERAATARPFAHVAVEGDGCAAFRRDDAARHASDINRLGRQFEEV